MRVTLWITTAIHLDTPTQDMTPLITSCLGPDPGKIALSLQARFTDPKLNVELP
jgi:hypothetical protein